MSLVLVVWGEELAKQVSGMRVVYEVRLAMKSGWAGVDRAFLYPLRLECECTSTSAGVDKAFLVFMDSLNSSASAQTPPQASPSFARVSRWSAFHRTRTN